MDIVPFLNLKSINASYQDAFQQILQNELNRSQWILGDSVSQFENQFAQYIGTQHAIGVSNGLDALTLIWKSLIQLGKLNEGDQVLVPAHTYIASVLSIVHAGLEPVLVDVNMYSYNTLAADFERKVTPKVKAILVVHLYGQMVPMTDIQSLAEDSHLLVVEDAAQAHGATFQGKKAGSWGIASAFSFYPSKNLGALGDGGAVTTDDEDLAKMVRTLSNYGSPEKYQHTKIGFNYRLDTLQAGFLSHKLSDLDALNQKRIQVALWYQEALQDASIGLPDIVSKGTHVYHLFVITSENRDALQKHLKKYGIQTMIHYPKANTQHEAFEHLPKNKCPNAETLSAKILSLPMCPTLTQDQVKKVTQAILSF